ncbi:uncharacterized protein with ParB-like and HNH nuclease domain [Thermosporothrix hazakensis]|jgi:uncharacterized protein with ParB-like and HNH nuclease domain|uniref:Uncharacterized protein with ParB-like and HNH nuclease domain n=2 Tax=Thermosporothrix TaxID=768650 RepID=A0A326TND0_THEHA|nr:DUF262 domain-containing protein [Thermosporothrix hazakensis]PZW18001.1 uncharacterized protein with ParB-like and HNH nuclease domain [Thermosporothrix hazakensis]BBH91653.1 hypothetical protein KTC_64040 [Thermosporothrix sp. COM3]GCE49796.1 hypothetical protein KTH_46650 [Thermosporothrix hazakensis]
MEAYVHQLLQFLDGKKQFIIPIYQRPYSWTEEQCGRLWDDILRAAETNMPTHFLGSIVYVKRGLHHLTHNAQWLIIDGQQRLTTLMLLLAALAHVAQDQAGVTGMNPEEIRDSYLINKFGKDEDRYKLLLTQRDREILKLLIDDPDQALCQYEKSLLIDNYRFFDKRLRKDVSLEVVYEGVSKLIFVDIALDMTYDNPQLIFESLNSTGVDLTQADLIRNYVLMSLDPQEQEWLYKEYWYPIEEKFQANNTRGSQLFDRFMRDYLSLKLEDIPRISGVYEEFKRYYQTEKSKNVSMHDLVFDIASYAEYFARIALSHEPDPELRRAFQDIQALTVEVSYPFLLAVYDDYMRGFVRKEEFITIVRMVESYVVRRGVCGLPTNALNKMFVSLLKEIDKQHYLESVQAVWVSKEGNARFPKNEEFRAAFYVKDIYNNSRGNYLLQKLENHKRPVAAELESYKAVYIMPASDPLPEEWQEELGPNWKEIQARYVHTIVDTPQARRAGILPSSSLLARRRTATTRSGRLSRSVRRDTLVGSRLPDGTL